MTECIHGLELSRCDLCSPKVLPKPEPGARPAPRTKSPRLPAGSKRPAAGSKRLANVAELRIHHITHVSNLEGILRSGALFADACDAWVSRPQWDVSSQDNRNLRRTTVVAGDAMVADYVPFYLSPDAHLWDTLRTGATDPRLSASAAAVSASEFVMLVSTVGKVASLRELPADADVVVSDRDAADPRAHFSVSTDDNERMLRRLLADREADTALHAEFLVKNAVPLAAFSLISVAHDKARKRVREILESWDFQPRVAVHPPWFIGSPRG
ncbi:MAG TPA: DarT ssDNA thymidine ADP-ribosyltransferase family protein [Terrimesophilobacter sp.]|nr:DarT ssDNA thymidine ADP-ribosyltransferase family protein [Terrimesophilobacter sp.]